jgi:hypothetical protein
MSLRFEPVQVAPGGGDTDGRLVFADWYLVAVLVRLSEGHGEEAGRWFLEAGFGLAVTVLKPPTFADLDEAQAWITQQLADASAQT